MSRGEPLDDEDREPWLHTIRQKAIELTSARRPNTAPEHDNDPEQVREMAEVHETSQHSPSKGVDELPAQVDSLSKTAEARSKGRRRACVIACSALKRKYRDLLRGQIQSLSQENVATDTISSRSELSVYHLYLHVDSDELLRRMHARKGHFMKESMLKSQLRALEEPLPEQEPQVIVLDANQEVDDTVFSAAQSLVQRLGELQGPPEGLADEGGS
jgi:gluconokinase